MEKYQGLYRGEEEFSQAGRHPFLWEGVTNIKLKQTTELLLLTVCSSYGNQTRSLCNSTFCQKGSPGHPYITKVRLRIQPTPVGPVFTTFIIFYLLLGCFQGAWLYSKETFKDKPLQILLSSCFLSAQAGEIFVPYPMRIHILLFGYPPHFPSKEGKILQTNKPKTKTKPKETKTKPKQT